MIILLHKQYSIDDLQKLKTKTELNTFEIEAIKQYKLAIYNYYVGIRYRICGNPCSGRPTIKQVIDNMDYDKIERQMNLSKDEIDYILKEIINWDNI